MENCKPIVVKNVSISFGVKHPLTDFSAIFPAGEVTCLMAPSGYGKTTLLRILAGLYTPDSGAVSGVEDGVSMVFQEDRLCPGATVLQNVLLAARKPDKAKACAILQDLALGGDLHTKVSLLSGGMQRRVAIARALLSPAPVLLLDEPFTGLDDGTKRLVADTILAYRHGRTTLCVTHDEDVVALLHASLFRMDERHEGNDQGTF